MRKILLVETILNGLVKIIKAIRFKSTCCKSSCNEPHNCDNCENSNNNLPEIKNVIDL
jgi:hypothetical protein